MNFDEIINIEYIGIEETLDIDVDSDDHLFVANGILTHNSAVEEIEFDHSHISGGISKINTADNVFGIFTSRSMREQGKYQLQLLKTRNSSGVGQKVDLDYNADSLRITASDDEGNISKKPSSSILNSVKNKSTVVSQPANTEAEVQSTKLKQMLADLKKK